jgi:D-3-phosphoglycerate dehydrogenase
MAKVFISTVPFSEKDRRPLAMLENAGIEYTINPLGRKLTDLELASMIADFDFLIAGTEKISEKVFSNASKLRLISRVGIGLDGLDLIAAKKFGVNVSYTPDAPTDAVSELTLALILGGIRNIHIANLRMHGGHWHRYFGRRISELNFGIIGFGRIGSLVTRQLIALGAKSILINDLKSVDCSSYNGIVKQVSKQQLYQFSDVVSLHVPLTKITKNMIRHEHLMSMKSDSVLINTSRGGIINEDDLSAALNNEWFSTVALDVFDNEPYEGNFAKIERCILTCHMGSMSLDCRARMEVEATEEVLRSFMGQPLKNSVPQEEYEIQREGLV